MPLPADIVARVSKRLAEHVGLELPGWVVDARAAQRIVRLGVTPSAYADIIERASAGELDELIEAVRVGETRLFRHKTQIAALVDHVVPALKKRSVRVWSAGCAAGEEAYTLAIVLARALPASDVSIVATDVSADALEVAERACYSLDHVPEEYRDAFGDDGRVRADIAGRVRLQRANLLDPAPGRDFDLVWCRNVLIYFTQAARKKAIARLVHATAAGGFVFVGYSESLRDVADLDPVRAGDAVYYVKRPRRADTSPGFTVAAELRITPLPPPLVPSVPVSPGATVIALTGHPDPGEVAAELTARLADDLRELAIDLDGADLLDDALAPVFRRVIAAARAAGVTVSLVATRSGARRWLARHKLEGV